MGAERDPRLPTSALVCGDTSLVSLPCGQQDKSSRPWCPGCQPSPAAAAARSGSWNWPSARGLHARPSLAVPTAWGRQQREEGQRWGTTPKQGILTLRGLYPLKPLVGQEAASVLVAEPDLCGLGQSLFCTERGAGICPAGFDCIITRDGWCVPARPAGKPST